MYCNQCGCELKDTAKFCKKCGVAVGQELPETSETKRKLIKFLYTNRYKLIAGVLIVILLAVAAVIGVTAWQNQKKAEEEAKKAEKVLLQVKSVDFAEDYEIDDGVLVLEPLHAEYSDGTVLEIKDYKVYIDTLEYTVENGEINAEGLEDGEYKVRLEWVRDGQSFSYEETLLIKHKVNTWGKYPDLPGLTGKEIAEKYGSMSEPEFGGFDGGDWGYAYVELSSYGIELCFPAGLFGNPSDYGTSDAQCLEASGSLSSFYYNMEEEMTLDELRDILDLNLTESDNGGCTGTLGSGNRIYIGEGQVFDNIYTPETTIKVTVSDDKRADILDYFF